MRPFNLSICTFCGGRAWGSMYSTPRIVNGKDVLMAVYTPCKLHAKGHPMPDRVMIPLHEHRVPTLGRDYVINHDVCLSGAPAVNGRCGDLDCVCAPAIVDCGARVWRTDEKETRASDIFLVCEDHGDGTLTLQGVDEPKMLLRIPKSEWSLVGILPFPIEETTPE